MLQRLLLVIEEDYDAFCLAYMFTYRDFEMGTLGLAWTGDLKNAGGVCEKNGVSADTKWRWQIFPHKMSTLSSAYKSVTKFLMYYVLHKFDTLYIT